MKNCYENLYEVRPIRDLREMITSSVELFGDKAAFLVKREGNPEYIPISYKKFKQDIDALGTALVDLGLKDKRIAMISENRYEWNVSYLAVLCGTGVAVPLDKELPPNEIDNLIRRSEANAVIYSQNLAESMETIRANHQEVCFINMDAEQDNGDVLSFSRLLERGRELLEKGNRAFLDAEIHPEVMNILLFTSGTTDTSKAVMLSQRNICENLMNMCSMLYIDEKDTFLSVLPIHHTYECTCGFLCQMYRGCTIAFCEGLRHIVKNLKESGCTIMNGVPLIFESMYKQIMNQAAKTGSLGKLKFAIRLSNALRRIGIDIRKKLFRQIHETFGGKLRLFISGAAAIDPQVAKGFRDMGINLVQGYGLTECSPIVTLNRDICYKDDAAGLPLPNLEVAIDNPNEEGIGEIKCKGPSVMLGYYKNEEATREAIRDGWFYTGDLGYFDEDGFLHITGRKKNVIVTKNGKNIYPEEIETLLGRSPYIKESLVYGKADEGDEDIAVHAMIVPNYEKIEEDIKNGTAPGSTPHEVIGNEVRNVNKQLVLYKYIRHFELRDEEFAKTTTKKIKRYKELK